MSHTTNSLIQIVPGLWPSADGIGDHALLLARRLREQAGVETTFIVCDPRWRRDGWSGEFDAVRLEKRSTRRMLEEVLLLMAHEGRSNGQILLHCSPYRYGRRGCPVWLVSALEAADERLGGRVSTAFHELDVESSRIFSSAYWVPAFQRTLLRRLLRLSQFAYTNTAPHRSRLQAWGHTDVSLIPNFASIGEIDFLPQGQTRERSVVVWGGTDVRRLTYTRGAEALAKVCAAIGAERIIDIGAAIREHNCSMFRGVPVVRKGVLPADEIAAIMRSSLASFAYYPVPLLTRSGMYALACASGTVAFICCDPAGATSCQGLTAGLDYLLVDGRHELPSLNSLQRLAPAIYASYGKRASNVAARIVADKLFGSTAVPPDVIARPGARVRLAGGVVKGRPAASAELQEQEVVR